jgi:hypothetical protein
MRKLQTQFRSEALSARPCRFQRLRGYFVEIDDYLGVRDSDYDKALKVLRAARAV